MSLWWATEEAAILLLWLSILKWWFVGGKVAHLQRVGIALKFGRILPIPHHRGNPYIWPFVAVWTSRD